ncbi:unnamed protein product [Cuscuta epithymum]|uniref:Reverse transcriptase zinc-binding domain-containing protein n=1 Tax=Cuscuta epithymum TaxID=186058 RepID=A0AAV0C8U3_9ASTE|nr:unnamed protein product [Cuscuta epithymum]
MHKWSDSSFEMLLKLLQEVFPQSNNCPKSYYETRKLLCDVGLGYELIDVCQFDCILFYGNHKYDITCPICNCSRYIRKKIPHKRARYFPLSLRLKRIYASRHTARDMRWHKEVRKEEIGVLRHPADGKAWKHFDGLYPEFAEDSRNIRMGLASDGFNPFSNPVWEFTPHKRDSQLIKKIALIRDQIVSHFDNTHDAISFLNTCQTNGKLSSSLVYNLLRVKGGTQMWMSFIWKNYIPPKFSFTVWLAFRNRLATIDNLHRLDVVNVCPLCKGGPETVPHLFFTCAFSGKVWHRVRTWLDIPREMGTMLNSLKWIKRKRQGSGIKAKAARIAFCYSIYWIWRTRNATCFDGLVPKEEVVFARIQYIVYKILYSLYPHELVKL